MIITINDIRRYHCVSGIRRFFNEQGLDFADFLKNGIESDKLLATGDALAERVVRMIADG